MIDVIVFTETLSRIGGGGGVGGNGGGREKYRWRFEILSLFKSLKYLKF